MTPKQKIKWAILAKLDKEGGTNHAQEASAENIDELYDEVFEGSGDQRNYEIEFSQGEVKTNIKPEDGGYSQSKSVAAEIPQGSGSWVGWTHYYGGGKHAQPEDIEWMDDAYHLTCTTEQKLVTIQTFKKT